MKYIVALIVITLLNATKCMCNKEELIKLYEDAIKYERGKFDTLPKSDSIILRDYSEENIKHWIQNACIQHKCYLTYNMLVFLQLVYPQRYINNNGIFDSIESVCPKWEQQILKGRTNTNYFRAFGFSVFTWVFYFFTDKMKQLSTMDYSEETYSVMQKLHYQFRDYINNEMPKSCEISPAQRQRDLFLSITKLEINTALEMLEEACKRQTLTVTDVKDFDLDRLYLNNVIEDEEFKNALFTRFGVVDDIHKIVTLLSTKMELIKKPNTSLSFTIHLLRTVHRYFIQMVKTIILRVSWTFLSDIKSPIDSSTFKLVSEFNGVLEEFADFLQLNSGDDFRSIINQLNNWSVYESFYCHKSMSMVTRLLERYDEYESVGKLGNCTTGSLKKIDIKSYVLEDPENARNANQPPLTTKRSIKKYRIQNSLLFAKSFVDYLKTKLKGVNFKVIHSFDYDFKLVIMNSEL